MRFKCLKCLEKVPKNLLPHGGGKMMIYHGIESKQESPKRMKPRAALPCEMMAIKDRRLSLVGQAAYIFS